MLMFNHAPTPFAQPPRPHNPPFAQPLEGEIPFAQPFALF